MRSIIARTLLLALSALLAAGQDQANQLTPRETQEGWKLLFDGQSLAGWKALSTSSPSTNGDFSAGGGAIVCPGTTPGWLATNDAFGDFRLKLEFRGAAAVNSGVFIRSDAEGQPHLTGYEVQIWDHQPAGYLTGSLVGSVKASPASILGGKWNQFEITAERDRYLVTLNGKTLLDARDSRRVTPGLIGLQCQKDNRIEFRNIRLLPVKK
jgi:hypothetical protein